MARLQWLVALCLLRGADAFQCPTYGACAPALRLRFTWRGNRALAGAVNTVDGGAGAASAAAAAAAAAADAASLAAQAAVAAVAAMGATPWAPPVGATAVGVGGPAAARTRPRSVLDAALELLQSNGAKRLAVWAPTLALCACMRPFYPIILGTYVLTLIGKQV